MDKKKNLAGNIVYSTNAAWKPEEAESTKEYLPATQQPVKVKLDRKQRAGKIVTLIEGLALNKNEFEDLAKRLKSYCSSGGSSKDDVIIIQGDHQQKIINWLHKSGFILAKKAN